MISPSGNAVALDRYLSAAPAHDLHSPDGFHQRVELESTIGDCAPESFIADMRRTRQAFGKERLKLETYHVIVSQTHEEADPCDEDAGARQHEVARAFIAEAFPGHQAKLTTQRDNGRVDGADRVWTPGKWHTHVQVASVSEREATLVRVSTDGTPIRHDYKAGRAIDGTMKDVHSLRRTMDAVVMRELGFDNARYMEACRQHSAALVTHRDGRLTSTRVDVRATRMDYALRADPDGPGYSNHDAVRETIRQARSVATNWDDYTSRLAAAGVQTRVTGQSGVSYAWTGLDGSPLKARARGKSGLGADTTKSAVEEQCAVNAAALAEGITPEAPEPMLMPPWSPASERPRPVYLTPDGRPQWDRDLDEYAEHVRQSGGTYEERARNALAQTVADPWVSDRDRLIAASPDYGIALDGRSGGLTVAVALSEGSATMNSERLGPDWTGHAIDERLRQRGKTGDHERAEAGDDSERRHPAQVPPTDDRAGGEGRRAADIARAADERARRHARTAREADERSSQHQPQPGRAGVDTTTGPRPAARNAQRDGEGADRARGKLGDTRQQPADPSVARRDRGAEQPSQESATPQRDRLLGNRGRTDKGRDLGR